MPPIPVVDVMLPLSKMQWPCQPLADRKAPFHWLILLFAGFPGLAGVGLVRSVVALGIRLVRPRDDSKFRTYP